jgi:hypothetical protein
MFRKKKSKTCFEDDVQNGRVNNKNNSIEGLLESFCNMFTILEVLLYEFFVLIAGSHSI